MDIRAIVSAKGQIVIPKSMREMMGLHYRSELIINLREDDVIEVRQVKKELSTFFGMGKRKIKEDVSKQQTTNVDEAISKAIVTNNPNKSRI